MNNICRNKNIKLVNLLTFDDRKDKNFCINLDERSGDCLYNLFSVSKKELPTMGEVDNRWCHLSKEFKTILSNILFDSLNSTEKDIFDLYKHKDFLYDDAITKRYEIDLDKK